MRRHCQTIAALLLTLLPRCGVVVVELGAAPAYGRVSREGANEGAGARGGAHWPGCDHFPAGVTARNAPERPAKRRKVPRKVPGKRQPPLQPPVGPGVC